MPTPQSQPNSLVVSVGVQTNVGKERTENQDRVTRAATPFGDLFVVADGVGGHQGGSEAAQTVVDGFAKYLNTYGTVPLPEALQQAVRAISVDLQQRSAANQALRGMGSTVVLCVVSGNHVTYAHAGDSRAYLVRDRKLSQLTRDHSVMERMVSQGILTPAQAREHPDASVLTRAIGQSTDVSLDIANITLQPKDALLLCSDGLWGYAKHEEMEAVATSESLSASGVATALLNLALEGGGGDNVSIQFLRFEAANSGSKIFSSLGKRKRDIITVTGLASALAIGSAGMFLSNQSHKIDPTFPMPETTTPAPPPRPPKKSGPQNQSAPEVKTPEKASSASSGKVHISSPEKAAPTVKVIIVQGKDGRIAADPWVEQLNTLRYLEIPSAQAASDDCLRLEGPKASIFYSPDNVAVANKVKKDIPGAVLEEVAAEKLRACGSEMAVLPALSKIDSVTGKVQTGRKVVLKKAEEAGKEVQKLGGQLGDEVKKHTPN